MEDDAGARIRAIRRKKRLTLRAAADRAGLALSTLSSMERGRHAIALPKLLQIAKALEVPPSALLPDQFGALAQHVSPDQRLHVDYGKKVHAELLTPPGEPTGLQMFHLTFAARGETGLAEPHRGWEYVYVVDGVVEVNVGGRAERLEPGDFFYFSANRQHLIRALEPAQALMISFGTGWLPGRP